MNHQIKSLRDLQEVNDKIRDCEDEQAALHAALEKRQQDIHVHQTRLDELQAKIKDVKREEDKLNLDLKSNEADINKLLGQLNQAKTNDEYSALNKRIAEERAQNSGLEDSILQFMTQVDELNSEIHSVKDALAKEQAEVASFETKIRGEIALLDARIKEHRVEAAAAEKNIEAEILERYHKLFERMDGDVMAEVDRIASLCLGCNLPVTKQDIYRVLADNGIVYCKSCGRILYFAEEEAQRN